MLLKELITLHNGIIYGDYDENWEWVEKKYTADEFASDGHNIEEEIHKDECYEDNRVFCDKYNTCYFVVTNEGLKFAPVNGDYIQSEIHDDLFILCGHDGFNVYELKGYKK